MSNTELLIGSKANESGLQPLIVTAIYSEADIFWFQQVGPRHGVSVEIIARAGQSYTHITDFQTGLGEGIYTGVVPDESAYIQLTKTGKGGLGEFWNEIARLKQESKDPSETT